MGTKRRVPADVGEGTLGKEGQLKQLGLFGPEDRLGTVLDLKLAIDVPQMPFHRADLQHQCGGDCSIRLARCELAQNLLLALA